MKWIELQKARKLQFNEPVFIKREAGIGLGRLKKKEQSSQGLKFTFELATFKVDHGDEFQEVADITHVAIP